MKPHLYVNQAGERYCDESMTPNFAFDGNALARLKEKFSYSIKDSSGLSSAFAINSGRIAGKKALKYFRGRGASR